MAFSFRKSLKIAPGVRLNIGKTGGSVRLGSRGMGYTFGTSGQRVTAGIPGTELSATRKIGAKGRRSLQQEAHLLSDEGTPAKGRSRAWPFVWVTIALALLWIVRG